ncbi:unnamed protein product, partial [marine sediment metagenome]
SCLGALIITLMLVPLRTRATLGELGFDKHTVRRDIAIGTTAFFVLVVPVLLLQLILTLLWKETSHPLVGLLRDDPSLKFFAMSGFAAVLVAPLVEEFFFRVLLQGWLETMFYRHSAAAQSIAAQADVAQPDAFQQVTDSELSTNEDRVEPDEEAHPYRSPTVAAQDHPPESGASPKSGIINNPSPWAIVISAFLFAIAHGGNGPDPIPLFLFG